jgi:hypothetical protein
LEQEDELELSKIGPKSRILGEQSLGFVIEQVYSFGISEERDYQIY